MNRKTAEHLDLSIHTKTRKNLPRELAISGLFAALIAAGAFIQVTIPVQPYPMHVTMQWFFVLLAGLLLEPKLAAGSVGTYLLIGLCGVPVFASGGGPAYLLRPTFGFLLGFLAAAWGMAVCCKQMRFSAAGRIVPALLGLFVYYAVGVLYFYMISNYVIAMPVGWKVVLVNCCLLTVGADFLLCLLAAAAAGRMRPAVAALMENACPSGR
ncbi:MAG TPA: biotin transporter BioY [Candidatus Ventrimonas merdavium]|nr:biotin transporter BioY [Candidatus Ventrimonas merdavium]